MSRDDGAASLVLLAVAATTLIVSLAIVAAGQVLGGYAGAQTAADAAALAAAPVTFRSFGAAGTPTEEAARFAALNGSRLVGCRCALDESWRPRTAVVTVERQVEVMLFGARTVTATARAEFIPSRLLE